MKEHKVLVLEDSISDQISLELIFNQFPTLQPIFTQNSKDFLKEIDKEPINLVVVDIVLKENCSGLEVLKHISDDSTWIIICSAHNCKHFYNDFRSLNFTKFYLQKPVDEYVLMTHLDSFLFSQENKQLTYTQ